MKNILKINSLIILGLVFILSSCSKDNAAAKKLDGIWDITSLTVNANQLIIANTKMETAFTDIEGNSGRYNTKAYAFNILVTDVSGNFNVSDDGTSITLDEDGSVTPGSGTIDELTSTNLKITYVDKDGNATVFKATKK